MKETERAFVEASRTDCTHAAYAVMGTDIAGGSGVLFWHLNPMAARMEARNVGRKSGHAYVVPVHEVTCAGGIVTVDAPGGGRRPIV